MTHVTLYEQLKAAVSAGSEDDVNQLLTRENINDLHEYFCEESLKSQTVCNCCEVLLKEPLEQENTSLVRLLLEHEAYPPEDICASGYQYNHTLTTPLKGYQK